MRKLAKSSTSVEERRALIALCYERLTDGEKRSTIYDSLIYNKNIDKMEATTVLDVAENRIKRQLEIKSQERDLSMPALLIVVGITALLITFYLTFDAGYILFSVNSIGLFICGVLSFLTGVISLIMKLGFLVFNKK